MHFYLLIFFTIIFTPLYGAPFVPGELIVTTYQPLSLGITLSSTSPQPDPILGHYAIDGFRAVGSKPPQAIAQQLSTQGLSVTGVNEYSYLISFSDKSVSLNAVMASFLSQKSVKAVQPNYIYKSTFTPNDPLLNLQWSVSETTLKSAWDISRGSSDVVIAIIDSGVDWQHPDLAANIWQNPNETANSSDSDSNGFVDDVRGWDFVDNDNNPMDTIGAGQHGTHVSGIAGAVGNNSTGISGACPNCKLMALRAGHSDGKFFTADIVDALDYARNYNADIINMSFGGEASDSVLESHVNLAAAAGSLMIAAAGNFSRNTSNFIPAKYSSVLAVSALKSGLTFDDSYSNFGNAVFISAPGTAIYSTLISGGTSYGYKNGTSMAAPFVAGVAGLMKSFNPQATAAELKTALQNSATDAGNPGHDIYYGYGIINPYGALLNSDADAPIISHTPIAIGNINVDALISAIVTSPLPDSLDLPVTLNYRYYAYGTPSGNWQQVSMAHISGDLYQGYIPGPPVGITDVYYYLEAANLKNTPDVRYLPATGISDPYPVVFTDYQAPRVSFYQKSYDYISLSSALLIGLTDNVQLDLTSILVKVDDGASVQSLTINSSALSYVTPNVVIDLPELSLKNGSISFSLSASDISGNVMSTASITLRSTASSFKFYGPEGEGSRVINAPNPFNPKRESTYISYQNSVACDITIKIYDLYGHMIKKWDRVDAPGFHEVEWDGRDSSGNRVPNGVYIGFIRAESTGGLGSVTRRIKIAVRY